jgi:hypothetical protein
VFLHNRLSEALESRQSFFAFTSSCLLPSRLSSSFTNFSLASLTPQDVSRPMIAIGAVAERGRLGPLLVFVFVWSTIVYDPIACWIWNSNGWSAKAGGLDFAGGSPVHISSGTAALALSIYLGKRRGYGTDRLAYKPNNTSYVILGTALLWFGWFGFNGGSALSANIRAAQACISTNLCASVAALTWMLWVRHRPLFSFEKKNAIKRLGFTELFCTGLAPREEVVSCRLLLWRDRWTRRDHPRVRFRRFSYVNSPVRVHSTQLIIIFFQPLLLLSVSFPGPFATLPHSSSSSSSVTMPSMCV